MYTYVYCGDLSQFIQKEFSFYPNLFGKNSSFRMCSCHHQVENFCFSHVHFLSIILHKPHPHPSRPLPPELLKYACEATHYLIYIFNRQRNKLIRRGNKKNNLICAVMDQSGHVCLKKYEKPLFSQDGCLKLYYKHKRLFNIQQVHVHVHVYIV